MYTFFCVCTPVHHQTTCISPVYIFSSLSPAILHCSDSPHVSSPSALSAASRYYSAAAAAVAGRSAHHSEAGKGREEECVLLYSPSIEGWESNSPAPPAFPASPAPPPAPLPPFSAAYEGAPTVSFSHSRRSHDAQEGEPVSEYSYSPLITCTPRVWSSAPCASSASSSCSPACSAASQYQTPAPPLCRCSHCGTNTKTARD